MLKLHFAVAEDEATLLTVMTRGLATEVEVPAGKDTSDDVVSVCCRHQYPNGWFEILGYFGFLFRFFSLSFFGLAFSLEPWPWGIMGPCTAYPPSFQAGLLRRTWVLRRTGPSTNCALT